MLVVLVTATIVTVLNNSMITVVLAAVGRDLAADHPAATPGAELIPAGAVRMASFAGACGSACWRC